MDLVVTNLTKFGHSVLVDNTGIDEWLATTSAGPWRCWTLKLGRVCTAAAVTVANRAGF